MTMFDFRSVDLDNLSSARPSSGGGGGYARTGANAFWNAKADTTMTIYFVSDPWTRTFDNGWYGWREVYARNGFVGGILPPKGMFGVPVNDAPDASDVLLALVEPYVNTNKSGAPSVLENVETKIGINIVEIVETPDGTRQYQKVLVLGEGRYKKLMSIVSSWRDMNDNFSLTSMRFVLTLTGKGFQEVLSLAPVKGAPPLEGVELLDIPSLLQEKRQLLLDHIQELSGRDLTAYREEAPYVAEEASPEDLVLEAPPLLIDADTSPDWASTPQAKIRALLARKGVSVKPRATHDELVMLAQEHLQ